MVEDEHISILEEHRPEIVQVLEPERTLMFDYLRSKGIFDSQDCELIWTGKTREQKVGKFLDTLATKGPEGYKHFIEALQLESPLLYEKLTGEKPTERPSPIMKDMEKRCSGDLLRLFDQQILTKQLKDAYDNLQKMACKYDTAVKEKKTIHQELEKLSGDLRHHEEMIVHLEKQNSSVEARAQEEKETSTKYVEGIIQQFYDLQHEYNQKTSFIIALQMKLLTTNEEVNSLKIQVQELETSKQGLLSQLDHVKGSYEIERTESMKWKSELQSRKNEIQEIDKVKIALRQALYKTQVLISEKDDALKQLEELQDWTEVLKTRYDIVAQELGETRESHEEIVSEKTSLRDQLDDTERKCRQIKTDSGSWKNRYEQIQKDLESYKQQRDMALEDRNQAIDERNKALEKRDEARKELKVLQEVLDDFRQREGKYMADFDSIKIRLNETLEEITRKDENLRRLEDDLEMSKRKVLLHQESGNSVETVFTNRAEDNITLPDFLSQENVDSTNEVGSHASSESSSGETSLTTFKKKDPKELIISIKKRFKSEDSGEYNSLDRGMASSSFIPVPKREMNFEALDALFCRPQSPVISPSVCSSLPRDMMQLGLGHSLGRQVGMSSHISENLYSSSKNSGIDEDKPAEKKHHFEFLKRKKNKAEREEKSCSSGSSESSSSKDEPSSRPLYQKSMSCPKLSNNIISKGNDIFASPKPHSHENIVENTDIYEESQAIIQKSKSRKSFVDSSQHPAFSTIAVSSLELVEPHVHASNSQQEPSPLHLSCSTDQSDKDSRDESGEEKHDADYLIEDEQLVKTKKRSSTLNDLDEIDIPPDSPLSRIPESPYRPRAGAMLSLCTRRSSEL